MKKKAEIMVCGLRSGEPGLKNHVTFCPKSGTFYSSFILHPFPCPGPWLPISAPCCRTRGSPFATRGCRALIEKNQQNQPRPWAGAFAVVYKGIDPDGPAALRRPRLHHRIARTPRTLRPDQRTTCGRKLNCLVDFEYRDRSIRSAGDGKWYPLILMEWVQGETLFNWAPRARLEGDTASDRAKSPTAGWRRCRS